MSRKWTYEIGYGYESILRNGVMVNKEQAVRALNNYEARIATLEKALNIDTDLTIAELRVDLRDATARIAELEADNKKAFDLVRKLRMYCIWANWDNPDTEDEFNEFDVEVCKWLSKFMEREE